MKFHQLSGTVHSIRFRDTKNKGRIARFYLNHKEVELRLKQGDARIENDDVLTIAGRHNKGIVDAIAYNNHTKKVCGYAPAFKTTAYGVGLLILPPLGIFFLYLGSKFRKANSMVKNATPIA